MKRFIASVHRGFGDFWMAGGVDSFRGGTGFRALQECGLVGGIAVWPPKEGESQGEEGEEGEGEA